MTIMDTQEPVKKPSQSALRLVLINLVAIYLPSLLFNLPHDMGWTPLFPLYFLYLATEQSWVCWILLLASLGVMVFLSVTCRNSLLMWVVMPTALLCWSLCVAWSLAVNFAV